MSNTSKILVDQKSGSNLLYLPLDKIMQMSTPAAPVDAISRQPMPVRDRRRRRRRYRRLEDHAKACLRSREREPR